MPLAPRRIVGAATSPVVKQKGPVVVFLTLVLLSLATLVTEDLTCIGAGVLVAQGQLSFLQAVLACLFGIAVGDLLLFAAGRWVGVRAMAWPVVARYVPLSKVREATAWLQQRGLVVVLFSRFVPGLRLPTYFAAGVLATSYWRFTAYFLLAAAVWAPLLVGASALLGGAVVAVAAAKGARAAETFLVACGMLFGLRLLMRNRILLYLRPWWLRVTQWEFWPPWAAYLPLIPYFFYLAARYRSLTLFTLANPGIFTGGLAGESKSETLRHLARVSGIVPEFELLPADLSHNQKIEAAHRFLNARGLPFPVVLKPDRGQRGTGVAIVRSNDELAAYLRNAATDTIIQRYASGVEFSVFYVRHPAQANGRIVAITKKDFPFVTGDGVSTIRDLIRQDTRAVAMYAIYERQSHRNILDVPTPGEVVQLVEVGAHCRGAVFRDATTSITCELESMIDCLAKAHPGFFFGRFDLRVPDTGSLQAGTGLSVLELNGVAAEPTHIYDPSVGIFEAYRTLAWQWATAFAIGDYNRRLGERPMPLRQLAAVIAEPIPLPPKQANTAGSGAPCVHTLGLSRQNPELVGISASRAGSLRV